MDLIFHSRINTFMGKRKQEVLAVNKMSPFTQMETNYKKFESLFNNWLAKQSLPVEVAIITATGAITGAATSFLVSTFSIPSVRFTSFNVGSFSNFVCSTFYDSAPRVTSLNLSLQRLQVTSYCLTFYIM